LGLRACVGTSHLQPPERSAILIRLQRKAFPWPPGAGDVAFTAFGGVTDAFLDGQLLKASKLFGTGEPAHDLTEIHRADLTDHGLDPGIMGGDLDDVGTAEAGSPAPQPVRTDFRLEGEPSQGIAIIFHLIAGRDALTRFGAEAGERSIDSW
jgi:hypothetical protein